MKADVYTPNNFVAQLIFRRLKQGQVEFRLLWKKIMETFVESKKIDQDSLLNAIY